MLDVPFTQAIKTISQWGSGSKELVAAMQKKVPTFKATEPRHRLGARIAA
jgi:hypothetical protein